MQFHITGPSAAELIIEAVGGIGETWVLVQTGSLYHGAFTFEDATPDVTNRFYRARLP